MQADAMSPQSQGTPVAPPSHPPPVQAGRPVFSTNPRPITSPSGYDPRLSPTSGAAPVTAPSVIPLHRQGGRRAPALHSGPDYEEEVAAYEAAMRASRGQPPEPAQHPAPPRRTVTVTREEAEGLNSLPPSDRKAVLDALIADRGYSEPNRTATRAPSDAQMAAQLQRKYRDEAARGGREEKRHRRKKRRSRDRERNRDKCVIA